MTQQEFNWAKSIGHKDRSGQGRSPSPGQVLANKGMKPKLLDLFCGAGGATKGYQRAGFYVVGVDIKPQPHYCGDEFYQADALEFPLEGYDAIHASPPCQGYCKETNTLCKIKHPRLIPNIRNRLSNTGLPFVIENVEGARFELKRSIMLCGSMFGLPIIRHRWFEINFNLQNFIPPCNHKKNPVYITGTPRPKNGIRKDPSASVKREALQTPWMSIKEMDEAIPPAYTEWIGRQLIRTINGSN